MEFLRQLQLFNPEEFNTPVHIIGAGATGSWLTLILAKLGVRDITVYDFDTVESHNLPNQFYGPKAVDKTKVEALKKAVYQQTGTVIKIKEERVDGSANLSGIVYVLTDTMSSRSEIYREAIKMKSGINLMVETRMGLEHGRVYCINPMSLSETERYEGTLYSDDEAEVSACGASQSVSITAIGIAQAAAWKLVKWHRGEDINNELIIDYLNCGIYPTKF